MLGGAVGVLLLASGAAYFKGDADAANRYKAEIATTKLNAADDAQKIRDSLTAQANSAIASLETKNAASRVVYRTITQQVDKIIDRPIYRDGVCLDSDGVVLVNAALGGVPTAPAATREPNGGMPRPLATQ